MTRSHAGLSAVGLGLLMAVLAACGPANTDSQQSSTPTSTVSPSATATASASPASAASPSTAPSLDPRYSTCEEAVKAGHGDYRKGVDPEYDWYKDSDGDGIACEIKK